MSQVYLLSNSAADLNLQARFGVVVTVASVELTMCWSADLSLPLCAMHLLHFPKKHDQPALFP